MILVVLFGAAMISTGSVGAAFAAPSDCNDVVADEAGVLGDERSKVEEAAKKLTDSGADVRILTIRSFAPAATLSGYVTDRMQQCDSWMSPSKNGIKTNLLVFAISTSESKQFFAFGSSYNKYFSDAANQNEVRAAMGAYFKGGDWAGGFVAGMVSSKKMVDAKSGPAGPAVVNNTTNNVDLSWMKWLLAIIAIGGLLAGGAYLLMRWYRSESIRKAARQRALSTKDVVSKIIQPFGDAAQQAVRDSTINSCRKAGADEARTIDKLKAEFDTAYRAATTGVSSVNGSRGNADMQKLSTKEYEALEQRWLAVKNDADAARKVAQRLDDYCAEITKLIEGIAPHLARLEQRVGMRLASIDGLKAKGHDTSSLDDVSTEAFTDLETAQAAGSSLATLPLIEKAENSCTQLEKDLASLTDMIRLATEGQPALDLKIAAAEKQVQDALAVFLDLKRDFGESSWTSVRGNGTEAQKRLEDAKRCSNVARSHVENHGSSWKDASEAVARGDQLVAEAVSLLDAISARYKHLVLAKESSAKEISDAQSDIDKAGEYLESYQGDVDSRSLRRDLEKARQKLQEARDELAQPMPNYLRVVDVALEANSYADKIYDLAVQQHDASERTRRMSVEMLRAAEASESKVRRYIENHGSDIGRGAIADLKDAKAVLEKARAARSAQDILRLATKARDTADGAYSSAKSDFDDAEAKRMREREAARQYPVYNTPGYGNSYSGGSAGGGFAGGFAGGYIGSSLGSSDSYRPDPTPSYSPPSSPDSWGGGGSGFSGGGGFDSGGGSDSGFSGGGGGFDSGGGGDSGF